MTRFLKILDRVALGLIVLGAFGMVGAVSEMLPGPPLWLAMAALVIGFVLFVILIMTSLPKEGPSGEAAGFPRELESFAELPYARRTPANSPTDPTVVGSIAWSTVGPGALIDPKP